MDIMNIGTFDWRKMHDRYYRRFEFAKMNWFNKVSLDMHDLIVAPLGGAIAVIRKPNLIQQMMNTQSNSRKIDIYNGNGECIASLEEPSQVLKIGWDECERLVLVRKNGSVVLHTALGKFSSRFIISNQIILDGLKDAIIWSNGVVCMTTSLEFYNVVNFNKPTVLKFAESQLTDSPTCWTITHPYDEDEEIRLNKFKVFTATQEGIIKVLSLMEMIESPPQKAPVLAMSVDPKGEILACFLQNGELMIILSNLSQVLSTLDLHNKIPPIQLVWCGSDSALCSWYDEDATELPQKIVLIGPHSTFLEYNYNMLVHFVTELDGVRIFSKLKCEFLQRVPDEIESVYRLDSSENILYQAYDALINHNVSCEELLHRIEPQLTHVTTQLIRAAALEPLTNQMQKILHAAFLGKSFSDKYPPNEFMHVCRSLRIINQLRSEGIGMWLTLPQFNLLGTYPLLYRLLNRLQYAVAYTICKYLGLNTDFILIEWACNKIRSLTTNLKEDDLESTKLANDIAEKVSCSNPQTSFSEIAKTAINCQQIKLATLLIGYEPCIANQIPILIEIKQDMLAMQKAIDLCDTDLMYLVIFHVQDTRPKLEFFNFLMQFQDAMALYIQYLGENDLPSLFQFYENQNRLDLVALLNIKQILNSFDFNARKDTLRLSLAYLKKYPNFATTSKHIQDELKLLLLQHDLELEFKKKKFVGLSLATTLYNCIFIEYQKTDTIVREFKVPNKLFWSIKMRALSNSANWRELEEFSKSKLPIDFELFVNICITKNNIDEAIKYIRKVKDIERKVNYCIQLNFWEDAYTIARDAKNTKLVAKIRNTCPDSKINSIIDSTTKS